MYFLLLLCNFYLGTLNSPSQSIIDYDVIESDSVPYTVFDTFEELQLQELNVAEDEILVVNFWATWCAPCIKEIPYFEALQRTNSNDKLRILLISLDFEDQLKTRYVPFIEKNNFSCDLAVLLDGDSNRWIDMVDPSWSGSIPATLFIKGAQKIFVEKEFQNSQEIEDYILNLK